MRKKSQLSMGKLSFFTAAKIAIHLQFGGNVMKIIPITIVSANLKKTN